MLEEKKEAEPVPAPPNQTPLMSEIQQWYRELHTRWPAVFPKLLLSQYWDLAKVVLEAEGLALGSPGGRARFFVLLKVAMLRLLRAAVNDCTACELHTHRLPGRAVLDDGDPAADPFALLKAPQITGPVEATVMLLGSHPGLLEGRTALPFTSATVLAGSACGSLCGEYGICFPPGAMAPQAPCRPKWFGRSGDELELALDRAADPQALADPGAALLDEALLAVGEWRASWNPRQRRRTPKAGMEPRPGTVYMTDLVKCPTGGPDPQEAVRQAKASEVKACRRWLEIQVFIVQPKVIVAMGSMASESLVSLKDSTAVPFAAPHPRWLARQGKEPRAEGLKKLQQVLRAARAAAEAPGRQPLELEVDPLAPRQATWGKTFPDAASEKAVKGS